MDLLTRVMWMRRGVFMPTHKPTDNIIKLCAYTLVEKVEQSLCLQLWHVSQVFDCIFQSDSSTVVAYWGDDEQQVIWAPAWGLPLRYPDWLMCVCTQREMPSQPIRQLEPDYKTPTLFKSGAIPGKLPQTKALLKEQSVFSRTHEMYKWKKYSKYWYNHPKQVMLSIHLPKY